MSDVPRFLQRLEEQHVAAAVLRWPEELAERPVHEGPRRGDVDLLVDGDRLETVIELASDQPGSVRCDLHTPSGKPGTTFAGVPHYPPILAQSLLENRVKYNSAFYALAPASYFASLAYHLVYHKGLQSGIASGCDLPTNPDPKRPYEHALRQVGESAGETLETPITLVSLHAHLARLNWTMPLDLLARWPKPTDWHRWLLRSETEVLRPWTRELPNLLVFFLRDDAAELGLRDAICRMLAERFSILAIDDLSPERVAGVMRQVRGGDWLERGKSTLIPPRTAIVCYDFNPATDRLEVAARQSGRRKDAFPLVENANVFFKHEIRRRLNRMVKAAHPILGLHAGDNACESQHMLRAVYGAESERMNVRFLAAIRERAVPQLRVA